MIYFKLKALSTLGIMKAYVIICYTGGKKQEEKWKLCEKCYSSIREHDSISTIIIVNNYQEKECPFLQKDKNLRYFINEENLWELGAIYKAVKENLDVQEFFILQESSFLLNKPPSFEKDIIFWRETFRNIAPALNIVKKWCDLYFPSLTYNSLTNKMCQCLMGFFRRETLEKAFDFGLSKIRVTNKLEAVASEGLFGMVLDKVLENIEVYHQYAVGEYMVGHQPWGFIKKIPNGYISGLPNSTRDSGINIFIRKDSICHPFKIFPFIYKGLKYESLYICIKELIEKQASDSIFDIAMCYYSQDREALFHLTEKLVNTILIDGDDLGLSPLYSKWHHDLCIIWHYGHHF